MMKIRRFLKRAARTIGYSNASMDSKVTHDKCNRCVSCSGAHALVEPTIATCFSDAKVTSAQGIFKLPPAEE